MILQIMKSTKKIHLCINNNIYDIQNILSQYHRDIIFSNMHIENINNLNEKIDTLIEKYNSVETILTNLGFNI